MTVAILLQYWGKGHLWTKLWQKRGKRREGFDFVSQKKSLNMVCSSYSAFGMTFLAFNIHLVCPHQLPSLIMLCVILSLAWSRGQTIFALGSAELYLVICLPALGADRLLHHVRAASGLFSWWTPESATKGIIVDHGFGWAPGLQQNNASTHRKRSQTKFKHTYVILGN